MPKPQKIRGKRAEITLWLQQQNCTHVGDAQWSALQRDLAPVSAGYLRRVLREVVASEAALGREITLAASVEGVRQESLDHLEHSLGALCDLYEGADRERRGFLRRLVMEAKAHAWLAGRKPELQEIKREMVLWMTIWLSNPVLFPQWVSLRRPRLASPGAEASQAGTEDVRDAGEET